jgi:hypothetical protein
MEDRHGKMVRQPEPQPRRSHRGMEHIRGEYHTQFEDSQRETTARGELQKLEMTWPLVDKYVSNFEKLARQAGYNHTNPETMHYFMGGLPRSVLTDVLRAPIPTTYHALKAKAIDAVRSRVLIDTLVKSKPTARPPNTNWFQPRNPTTTTTEEPTGLQPTTVQLKHGPAQL